MDFYKYHGAGNDFVIISLLQSPSFSTQAADGIAEVDVGTQQYYYAPLPLTPEQCRAVCNRHFGVGADGVLFAAPGMNGCDFAMRVMNADGSEGEMCGNGIRCVALFLYKYALKEKSTSICIWTRAGPIQNEVLPDGQVRVNMGPPRLAPHELKSWCSLGTDSSNSNSTDAYINTPISGVPAVTGLPDWRITAVSMGNPHAVSFVPSLDSLTTEVFAKVGPAISHHAAFVCGTNAEVVQVLDRATARMLVWERGAGRTLACGTGACAVVVAGVLNGLLDTTCAVHLDGGRLDIEWDRDGSNNVFKTGPAREVFRGVFDPSAL